MAKIVKLPEPGSRANLILEDADRYFREANERNRRAIQEEDRATRSWLRHKYV